MDFGTILLIMAIIAGLADMAIMLIGPRIRNHETISIILTSMGCLFALGALLWLGGLIFTNQFQYEYVYATTNINAPWLLKLSALWAGQSGSLVFWTAISFLLLMTYRRSVRGYEDDTIVYRAAVILALQTVLIGINALAADPFRPFPGPIQADGLGLNPLLSTIWNVIHPPIVFIAYAIAVIPFAVKLAGFTVRSEERNAESIPVLESLTRFMTVASWLTLSVGIAIGGFWAYIVLGWGGYWAWDPVETTSLVPWLLLTAYYHAKAIFKKNDVLRDSFLVFTYVTVIYATWVTRSGVLNSVHGFSISLVSWTMFATVLFNFFLATILTIRAGYVDMSDDEDNQGWNFFSLSNLRDLSIKIALIGILVILTTSVSGVVIPAALNLVQAIVDPIGFTDNMVSIGLEFFRAGFYAGSLLLVVAAFYCMRSTILRTKLKSIFVLALLGVGGVLAVLTITTGQALPTYYWQANALIPVAVFSLAYLVVAFVRTMAGREGGTFTMRRMGRLMLHLGLVMLLLGVFLSENVVHETNNTYIENESTEIAPGIRVSVESIDLVYWVDDHDFELHALIAVIENNQSAWLGQIVVRGNPQWQSRTQDVFVQSTALRDVFISVSGFEQISQFPQVLQVRLQTKVLPMVSFVWLGTFLMVMALLPMSAIELLAYGRALKGRHADLYGPDDEDQNAEEIAEAVEN
jgi:cytochrome c-type biogenesis protein CcmF